MRKKFPTARAGWHVVFFAMAAIALASCAFAGSGAGNAAGTKKMAEASTLAKNEFLDSARHRFENLQAEIRREAEAALRGTTNSTSQTNPGLMGISFSRLLETLKEKAPEYSSRCRTLRAEIANKELPGEFSDAKNDLLSSIDARLSQLEKLEKTDLEGLVDGLLDELEKRSLENDDADKGGGRVRDWFPLALSLVPACEFPGRESDVYGVRLNVVGGSHHDAAGMDVGVLFNHLSKDLHGIQFGGLSNIAQHRVEGIQFAGVFNLGGCRFTGLQVSGGVNAAGDAQCVQVAVLGNFDMKMQGCQIAGGGNFAIMGRGCQFAGCGMNFADRLTGTQCSGTWNVGNVLDGMQLAPVNVSDKCRGVQIGAVNVVVKMAGLQVGVVNCAEEASGCQIGLFNVITESSTPFLPVVNMSF